ncbi:MAG: GtrA family protein [Coriobacteriales bacterium]|jgi:putative flippase GtrA|nr:GtrA family protein [Coriobacteriales bacterium]
MREQDSTGPAAKRATQATVFRQGLRYLVVGFSSAAIELVLFFVLYQVLGIFVVASNVVALTAATVFNFTLSRTWTFQSVQSLPRSLVLYLVLFAWNQFFSSVAIVGLIDLGVPAMLAKVITMGVIVCWNFVLYRKVVFR